MSNPFEEIIDRLTGISNVLEELKSGKQIESSDSEHDTIFTEHEAANFLKISRQTLKKYRDNKSLPFIRLDSMIRYRKSDLLNIKKIVSR